MKTIFYCATLTLTLSSCAKTLNSPRTQIKLYAAQPVTVTVNDRTYHVERKTKIEVERQNKTLEIKVSSDSVQKGFKLEPRNSFNYLANVLTYGIGFLFDKGPKRYTYQRSVFLDPDADAEVPSKFPPGYKKQTKLLITLPWANSFYMQPSGEGVKSNTGFWGISLGVDRYYKPNKFVNATVTGAMDLFVPVPAPVDIYEDYEVMSTVYGSVTDNFVFERWSVGYGLNYSKNVWRYITYEQATDPPREDIVKRSQSLGVVLNTYYRMTDSFYVGVVYRPTFFTVKPTAEFSYEHLISLDLAWRIRLDRQQ